MSPDFVSVVVRTLEFICLFQAAGAAFFMRLFGARLPRSASGIARLGVCCALAAIVLLATHQELEAARMADGFAGVLDSNLQHLAWTGSGGNAALLQMLGMGVVALGLAQHTTAALTIASTGATIAALAGVLTGHTSVHPQHALLALLLAVHLLLVAFWFGALLPLIWCSRCESREHAMSVLRGFSAVAGPLVPCIGVAGLLMALILIPGRAAWYSTYGALIVGKLSVFAVLMLLAAWNRWRGVPAIELTNTSASAAALRRSISIEYLLMWAVLSATALLTTFNSP
jgi:putative copper export protein